MAYDWLLIKREYVQGYPDEDGQIICPTLEQLCERHGCSISTILKKSSSEKWKQERNIFGIKRNKKIQEKHIEVLVEESTNIDNKALTAADVGISIGLERLNTPGLSNHDYQKLSVAIGNFHRMGKLALGEPTEHIRNEGRHDVNFNTTSQQRILKQEGYTG